MRVLSFDVGIKNLAYCILEKEICEDNTCKYIINDYKNNWNIIDLILDETIKCNSENCKNKITLYTEINNTKYFFCSKHKQNYKELLENNPLIIEESNMNEKCCFSNSCKIKSKWDIYGQKLCNKHKINIENKINKNRLLQTYTNFVKSFSMLQLKTKLLHKLDNLKHILLNVDYVCIENQPTLKNPSMKAISDVLYTWFLIRGVIDKELHNSNIKEITFFSPLNKLKIKNKTEEINTDIDNSTNKYKKTKDLGIQYCLEFINYNQEYVDYLTSFQKKDDLCDAFLHCVNFLEKNKKCINSKEE
jgi:hypothetical protein